MKKFKSKIDWWFYALVIFLLILPIYLLFLSVIIGILFICIDIFLMHVILTTNYTLTETYLHIKAGFIYNLKIPYTDIISFEESRNPLSSPAMSIDRIEINYVRKSLDSILISPREKKEFLTLLSERWLKQSSI